MSLLTAPIKKPARLTGRVLRESYIKPGGLMADSHQRLSDVADNAVVNSQVISSYAGQGDNSSVWRSVNSAVSVQSSACVAVGSGFDNDLSAGSAFNQEELQSTAVASGQSAAVEGVTVAQNDRVASCELSRSAGTDCEVRAVWLSREVESLFNSSISNYGSSGVGQNFQLGGSAAAVEVRDGGASIGNSFLHCVVRSNDCFNSVLISDGSFSSSYSVVSCSCSFGSSNKGRISCSFSAGLSLDSDIFSDVSSSCSFESCKLGNSCEVGIDSSALSCSGGSCSVVSVQSVDVSNGRLYSGNFCQGISITGISSQASLGSSNVSRSCGFQSSICFYSGDIGISLGFASSIKRCTSSSLSSSSVSCFCSQNSDGLAASSVGNCSVSSSVDGSQLCVKVSNYSNTQLSCQSVDCCFVGSFVSQFSGNSSRLSADQTQTSNLTWQSAGSDCSQSGSNRGRGAINSCDGRSCASNAEVGRINSVSVSLSYESLVGDDRLVSSRSVGQERRNQLVCRAGVSNPVGNFGSSRSALEQVGVDSSNQVSTGSQSAEASGVLSSGNEGSANVVQSASTGGDLVSPVSQASLISSATQQADVQLLNLSFSVSSHYSLISNMSRIDTQASVSDAEPVGSACCHVPKGRGPRYGKSAKKPTAVDFLAFFQSL